MSDIYKKFTIKLSYDYFELQGNYIAQVTEPKIYTFTTFDKISLEQASAFSEFVHDIINAYVAECVDK